MILVISLVEAAEGVRLVLVDLLGSEASLCFEEVTEGCLTFGFLCVTCHPTPGSFSSLNKEQVS